MASVYVSSTFQDLSRHRTAVIDALRGAGHGVACMEDYGASDERPLERCLADVGASEIYVGIVAWRYGFVPLQQNPRALSITQLEYDLALSARKTCLLFLSDEAHPWPRSFVDDGTAGQKLASFRALVSDRHIIDKFTTPDDLAARVVRALDRVPLPRPPQAERPAPSLPFGLKRIFHGHREPAQNAVIASGGQWAATGGADSEILVWNLQSYLLSCRLGGHVRQLNATSTVNRLSVSHDGAQLFSAGQDATIRIWNIGEKTCAGVLEGHTGPVSCIDARGPFVLSSGVDQTIRSWTWRAGAKSNTRPWNSARQN